ncbi:MAG: hypothetical protein IKA96_05025 [Alistipes sp.]|nr:hypothetical protein [Alistipes sp.]MBR3794391.1 hypothetical protein [Alistipes sp.]
MIHDEICTYEVCKLAKEKGFPQDVFGTCEMKSACYLDDGRFYKDGCIYPIENAYTAPTQSLLQRWLREEKALHIQITLWGKGWYYDIWAFEYYEEEKEYSAKMLHQSPDFDTHELALEEALKYALENLV